MFLKEFFHCAYNSNYRCDLLIWLSRPHLEGKRGQSRLRPPTPPRGELEHLFVMPPEFISR